jgi:hypothetical protein
MKTVGKEAALAKLNKLKEAFRDRIAIYEKKAKNCDSCETFGACCVDAHFVNVHVTELEAEAINRVLSELPMIRKYAVEARIDHAIETFELRADGDTFAKTFACPLFEKTSGCLVHIKGKPLACINHACYARREDLPPDGLMEEAASRLERLNEKTFRRPAKWLPLPLALRDRQKA